MPKSILVSKAGLKPGLLLLDRGFYSVDGHPLPADGRGGRSSCQLSATAARPIIPKDPGVKTQAERKKGYIKRPHPQQDGKKKTRPRSGSA